MNQRRLPTDNSSKTEPSRDDSAEQDARNEEYKQETQQLLEFHRQDKNVTPSLFLGILSLYLLLIGTLAGIGVLAFYSGHNTTREIFLVLSIILVLILPFIVIWYLRVSFRRQPAEKIVSDKQSLTERVMQSSVSRYIVRIGNSPIARLLNFAFSIYMIAYAIIKFPSQPRFSLAYIVGYTALFVILVTFEIARSIEKMLRKEINEIWEFNKSAGKAIVSLGDVTIASTQRHNELVEAHKETTERILDAIVAVQRTVQVMPNITEADQMHTSPEEPASQLTEGDKEPD